MEADDRLEPWCEINVQRTQGVSVVELRGELRLETSAHLEESIRPVLESPGLGVVLDFGEVTYVTSSALHVIVEAWNVLEKRGIPMVLSCLHGNVKRVFDVVHLTENLRVLASREAAVEYLAG
jgi:anti-anti-sigma factor